MGENRPPRGGFGATGGSRSGQHVPIEFDTGRGRARANDSFLIFARAVGTISREDSSVIFALRPTLLGGRARITICLPC